ncbi:MAG: ABC transporter permease [Anaerolineae bacterium]|nr:ABC transporter permease [Anaerolineae bacterium]
MRNIWLVIKHEILTTLSRRSFWIGTFVLPVVIMSINLGSQAVTMSIVGDSIMDSLIDNVEKGIGCVDYAGIIDQIPEDIYSGILKPFEDEASAQAALDNEDIEQYYIIPENFVETGDITVVTSDLSVSPVTTLGMVEYIINIGVIGDEQTAAIVSSPDSRLHTEDLALTSEDSDFRNRESGTIVAYGAMMVFFLILSVSSGYMLRSVSKEKENRTVEVLLLSLKPQELMLGKLLGLSVIALLQVAVWGGGGNLLFNRSAFVPNLLRGIALPPNFFIWAFGYFILGYLLYSSVMAAIGALAPSARESGQFTFMVMVPLIIPIWLSAPLTQSPNGVLATILSLFPLTAPVAMVTRMASTTLPTWQPVVGLAGLAVTTYGLVLLSARFFRADTLLSTKALNWKSFAEVLKREKTE